MLVILVVSNGSISDKGETSWPAITHDQITSERHMDAMTFPNAAHVSWSAEVYRTEKW